MYDKPQNIYENMMQFYTLNTKSVSLFLCLTCYNVNIFVELLLFFVLLVMCGQSFAQRVVRVSISTTGPTGPICGGFEPFE